MGSTRRSSVAPRTTASPLATYEAMARYMAAELELRGSVVETRMSLRTGYAVLCASWSQRVCRATRPR